ncbi:MAG: hypothetical protein V7785_04195 [Bermanella sp.]
MKIRNLSKKALCVSALYLLSSSLCQAGIWVTTSGGSSNCGLSASYYDGDTHETVVDNSCDRVNDGQDYSCDIDSNHEQDNDSRLTLSINNVTEACISDGGISIAHLSSDNQTMDRFTWDDDSKGCLEAYGSNSGTWNDSGSFYVDGTSTKAWDKLHLMNDNHGGHITDDGFFEGMTSITLRTKYKLHDSIYKLSKCSAYNSWADAERDNTDRFAKEFIVESVMYPGYYMAHLSDDATDLVEPSTEADTWWIGKVDDGVCMESGDTVYLAKDENAGASEHDNYLQAEGKGLDVDKGYIEGTLTSWEQWVISIQDDDGDCLKDGDTFQLKNALADKLKYPLVSGIGGTFVGMINMLGTEDDIATHFIAGDINAHANYNFANKGDQYGDEWTTDSSYDGGEYVSKILDDDQTLWLEKVRLHGPGNFVKGITFYYSDGSEFTFGTPSSWGGDTLELGYKERITSVETCNSTAHRMRYVKFNTSSGNVLDAGLAGTESSDCSTYTVPDTSTEAILGAYGSDVWDDGYKITSVGFYTGQVQAFGPYTFKTKNEDDNFGGTRTDYTNMSASGSMAASVKDGDAYVSSIALGLNTDMELDAIFFGYDDETGPRNDEKIGLNTDVKIELYTDEKLIAGNACWSDLGGETLFYYMDFRTSFGRTLSIGDKASGKTCGSFEADTGNEIVAIYARRISYQFRVLGFYTVSP